jgi:predicted secreted protein
MVNKQAALFLTIAVVFSAALVFAGCASTVKIEFEGNESIGDRWSCRISPEGVVRLVSDKFNIYLPFSGMGGKFVFKFEAIAEGEAEILLTHYFRGTPRGDIAYTAVVDRSKRLTLTKVERPFDAAADFLFRLRGTWYNNNNKTALRFLEDTVQIARNVNSIVDIENAVFVDFGTYTADVNIVEREKDKIIYDILTVTVLPEYEKEIDIGNTSFSSDLSGIRIDTKTEWLYGWYRKDL